MNSKNNIVIAVLISGLFFALSVNAGPKRKHEETKEQNNPSSTTETSCYCFNDQHYCSMAKFNNANEETIENLALAPEGLEDSALLEKIATSNDLNYLQELAADYAAQALMNNCYAINANNDQITWLANFYTQEATKAHQIEAAIYARINQLTPPR